MIIISVMVISINVLPQDQDISAHKNQLEFPQLAFSGGMMEVRLGKLAQERASSDKVKEFGERMIHDHSKANDELKDIAKNNDILLPDNIIPEQQKTLDELSRYNGHEFDEHYMRTMVQDHKADIKAFEDASRDAKNEHVRRWVRKTLPTLKQHLKLARETLDGLNQGK
jgi:putative membrane protein